MPKYKNPTSIREMVNYTDLREAIDSTLPVDHMKTHNEATTFVAMPGDNLDGHPLSRKNPWLDQPSEVTRRQLAAGIVPENQIPLAEWALQYFQGFHGD